MTMPPPKPPRWMNPGCYSNGGNCWDVEKRYNALIHTGRFLDYLEAMLLTFRYGTIYTWNESERAEIVEAGK